MVGRLGHGPSFWHPVIDGPQRHQSKSPLAKPKNQGFCVGLSRYPRLLGGAQGRRRRRRSAAMEFCPACGLLLQIDPGTGGHRLRLYCPVCPYVCPMQNKVPRPIPLPRRRFFCTVCSLALRCLTSIRVWCGSVSLGGAADREEGEGGQEGGRAHLQQSRRDEVGPQDRRWDLCPFLCPLELLYTLCALTSYDSVLVSGDSFAICWWCFHY